jgi:hypothetical protein
VVRSFSEMTTYFFFWGLLIVTCGYALWRGRKYEQISAGICIAATVLSVMFHSSFRQRYFGIEAGDLIIDTLVLFAFVIIALRSDRFWPLWVAGLQLTISMSHVSKALVPSLMPFAYAAAERFWSYPTLIIIFLGAWRQHRRTRVEQGGAPI